MRKKPTKGINHGFVFTNANLVAVLLPIKRGNSKLENNKKRPRTPSTKFKCLKRLYGLILATSFVPPAPPVRPYFKYVGRSRLPVMIAPPVNHASEANTLRTYVLYCK